MPTRSEQIAQLALLSGDRRVMPLADLLGQQDDRRQPTHIGSGFLYDPTTRGITQDPKYAEFERQKHRDALEVYEAREDAQYAREVRAAERANERAVRTGTTQLSRSLGDLAELESMIATVDESLAPYTEQGKDIPGMGGIFNALPGASAEARQMQQSRQAVMNVLLKARSGAAVTEPEFERFRKEFGSSVFSTDDDFLVAWQNLKKAIGAKLDNIYAGFDPEVVENYESNRGRAVDDEDEAPTADQQWVIDESGKPVRVR